MADITFGKGRNLERATERLKAWLAPRVAPSTVVEIRNLRYPIGAGTSNETILFEAVLDDGSTQPLVLRVQPAPDYQMFLDTAFDRQYRLLDALHRGGYVRVPRVLWYDEDPSWFERPFFVMEQMRGRVPVSMPVYNETGWLVDATPAERRTVWESATRELGRIHQVPTDAVAFLAAGDPSRSGFEQALDYAGAHYEWACAGGAHPLVDRIREWVYANVPDTAVDGLSWGDARMGNMMFGDDYRLVGVMDWEQACLGGPWVDLGWWLFFDDVHSAGHGVKRLDGLGTRAETIALWEDVVGQHVPDLHWYEVFAGFRVATLVIRTSGLRGGPPGGGVDVDTGVFTRIAYERLGWDWPAE